MTGADTDVLVRRAKEGDDRAVAALLKQYTPLLANTARLIGERARDELEGQSKAYQIFHRALQGYGGGSSFTAYLRTALTNAFKDAKKQAGRKKYAPSLPINEEALDQPDGWEHETTDLLDLLSYRESWNQFCTDAPHDEPTICYAVIASHEASGHWRRKFCIMAAAACGFSFGQGALFDEELRDEDSVRSELSKRLADEGWQFVLEASQVKMESVRRDMKLSREAIRAMQTLLAAWANDQTGLLEVVSEDR